MADLINQAAEKKGWDEKKLFEEAAKQAGLKGWQTVAEVRYDLWRAHGMWAVADYMINFCAEILEED